MLRFVSLAFLLACLLGWVLPARAGTLTLTVTDAAGKPLPDAVALLEPVAGKAPVKPMPDAEIAQRERQFAPRVTLITTGTKVNFPNFDTVRHHVYSFSAIKQFELKLYAGVPGSPVVFDKPGVAVIGCNIHDSMAGWIVVADTPWHAIAGPNGRAIIAAVPPGSYRLSVWHAGLPPNAPPTPTALTVLAADQQHAVQLTVQALP
jgi:plastocyanin